MEMDSSQWQRFCRQSGLFSENLTPADADIIYQRAKHKMMTKLDIESFDCGLGLLAHRLSESYSDLLSRLHLNVSVPSSRESVRGPARFFYDKRTYTGTHANGGMSVTDRLDQGLLSGKLELSQLCDRSACDKRGRKVGNPPVPGFSTHSDRKRYLKDSSEGSRTTRGSSVMTGGSFLTDCSQITSRRTMQGPERFFYDKNTYTGTHRFIDHPEKSSVQLTNSDEVSENKANADNSAHEEPVKEVAKPDTIDVQEVKVAGAPVFRSTVNPFVRRTGLFDFKIPPLLLSADWGRNKPFLAPLHLPNNGLN